jgi:hypothetical protein
MQLLNDWTGINAFWVIMAFYDGELNGSVTGLNAL